jgi:hypothetical protein
MDRRELENGMNENEILDAESRKVAGLLSTLRRAEAPANFEFGLKAKMAVASDVVPRASLIPFARVAAPLTLTLVVVGFVIFYGVLPGDDVPIADVPAPPVVEVAQQGPDALPPAPSDQQVSGPREAEDEDIATTAKNEPRAAERRTNGRVSTVIAERRSKPLSADREPAGGSRDSTLGTANVINAPVKRGEIPIRDVLTRLGINAEFVDGGWKVRSATANGRADRSGVRADDVLEALDGKILAEDTIFPSKLEPKKLQVRRDGKSLDLSFQD